MKSIGFHQVPVAQKKIVKPLRKGSSVSRNHASGAFSIKSEPASVEMAIAPMLIQYGGERSAGENLKNDHPNIHHPAPQPHRQSDEIDVQPRGLLEMLRQQR